MFLEVLDGVSGRVGVSPNCYVRWCKAVRTTEPEVPQHIQGRRHPKAGMHVDRRRRQRLVWCRRRRAADPQRTCPELRQPERVTFRLLTFLIQLEGSLVRRVATHDIRANRPGVNQRGHHCLEHSSVAGARTWMDLRLCSSTRRRICRCSASPLRQSRSIFSPSYVPVSTCRSPSLRKVFIMPKSDSAANPPHAGPPPNLATLEPMSARRDFETPPRQSADIAPRHSTSPPPRGATSPPLYVSLNQPTGSRLILP